jgi:hypothetical protein
LFAGVFATGAVRALVQPTSPRRALTRTSGRRSARTLEDHVTLASDDGGSSDPQPRRRRISRSLARVTEDRRLGCRACDSFGLYGLNALRRKANHVWLGN